MILISLKDIFCAFLMIALVNAASLPSGMKVCKKSGGDYQDCITKAIKGALEILASGNKEMGIPPLEPLYIKKIFIKGNGGSVDLDQTFDNIYVNGLVSTTEVLSFNYEINDKKCELNAETMSKLVSLVGPYKASGKMLLFSLNGHGNSNITLVDLKSILKAKCEIKGDVINVYDFKVQFSPKQLLLDIDNLIDGNKQLSVEVLKVMNENSEDVFKEVRADYESTYGEIFKQYCNKLFNKVPYKEIFMD